MGDSSTTYRTSCVFSCLLSRLFIRSSYGYQFGAGVPSPPPIAIAAFKLENPITHATGVLVIIRDVNRDGSVLPWCTSAPCARVIDDDPWNVWGLVDSWALQLLQNFAIPLSLRILHGSTLFTFE